MQGGRAIDLRRVHVDALLHERSCSGHIATHHGIGHCRREEGRRGVPGGRDAGDLGVRGEGENTNERDNPKCLHIP
jgi:hypothetical protein